MRSIFEYCAYHARMTPRLGPPGVPGYSYGVSLGEFQVWLETTLRSEFRGIRWCPIGCGL